MNSTQAKEMIKTLMEQGRALNNKLDARLVEQKKMDSEAMEMQRDLDTINKTIRRMFAKFANGCDNPMQLMIEGTRFAEELEEYMAELGYAPGGKLKDKGCPVHGKKRQRREDDIPPEVKALVEMLGLDLNDIGILKM